MMQGPLGTSLQRPYSPALKGASEGSANGSRAIEILMMISKQLMEEAKGRFPELGEGAGERGKVVFTP